MIELRSALKLTAFAADESPPLAAAPCRRPSICTLCVRVQVIPPLAPFPRDQSRVQTEVSLRGLMRIGGIALMVEMEPCDCSPGYMRVFTLSN
jgi:hypothetical protein